MRDYLLGALVLLACSSGAGADGAAATSAGGGAGARSTSGSSGSGGGGAGGGTSAGGVGGGASGGASTTGARGGVEAGGGLQAGSAGAEAEGGAPAGGTAGAEAGAAGEPSSAPAIDYAIWQLQLPTGSGNSIDTVSPAELLGGFSNDYFYTAPDGGQIFMDPKTGVTTSGSQHCRSEMRELAPGGDAAAWSSGGSNTLSVEGKVLEAGAGQGSTVTIGQVFNASDSIPLCELEYSSGRGGFQLLYEEAKGAGSTQDLKTPLALGERYRFTLALSDGVLAVSLNGAQVYTRTPSAGTSAKKFYFKFGNYDQTASAGPVSATPYTRVEVYSAVVVHE